MIIEKSCGAVVFTKENGCIKYVIIESRAGVFGFPKGHVENNESEHETARREIFEETGLQVEFLEKFRAEDSYLIKHNGEDRMKHVVYFLAEFKGQRPIPQESELNSIRLLDLETALSVLQFESSKSVLYEAHTFLTS
jgi:8-oxo-dGTP pyrophosphatase MutT (NUDIX family)